MNVGGVLVAGQRVADQDRVGAVGREFAIGLIGDGQRAQGTAAVEAQRLSLVRPFDDRIVIAGQETIGLERPRSY